MVKPVTENNTDAISPEYEFDSKDYTGSGNITSKPYLQVDVSAGATAVSSVKYYYRYSTDGTTYGSWIAYQTATTAPYNVTFNFPSGPGYYEFYSSATDSLGDVEPDPALYDTSTTYQVSGSGGSTPTATDTPTMSQWGLILLGTLLFRLRGNAAPHAPAALPLPRAARARLGPAPRAAPLSPAPQSRPRRQAHQPLSGFKSTLIQHRGRMRVDKGPRVGVS